MKANDYRIMVRCVEDGIERGVARARKHDDDPPMHTITNAIYESIMAEICEWFSFEEVPE